MRRGEVMELQLRLAEEQRQSAAERQVRGRRRIPRADGRRPFRRLGSDLLRVPPGCGQRHRFVAVPPRSKEVADRLVGDAVEQRRYRFGRQGELTRDDDAFRRDTRHQVGAVAGHDVETLCEFFDAWGGQVDLRVGGTGGRQRRRIDCRARSCGPGLTRGRGRDARPRGCQGNAQRESQPVYARCADSPARVTALVSWRS